MPLTHKSVSMDLLLQPSRYLLIMLLCLHGVALLACLITPLNLLLKVAVSLAVLLSLAYSLTRYATLATRFAIVQLRELANGTWLLLDKQGRQWSAVLQNRYLATNLLIILNFSIPGKRLAASIPIMRDALSAEQFRRLNTKLRLV